MKKKVYVTLQNGKTFQGYRFGAEGEVSGELVFSTNMVGYVETLTDPTNYGQILVQTFPLIGNYGVMQADMESKRAWAKAFIVREACEIPSNFRSEGTLDAFLKEQNVVGVYGIDTRELTKILREEGTMTAVISNKPSTSVDAENAEEDCVKIVAPTQRETYGAENAKYTLALLNLGTKKSIIEGFVNQNCRIVSLPATATAEEILSVGADGVVIGDGPGNPKANLDIVEEIKKLVGKTPVFGVGLGHLLFALALGADTKKLKYGHRGGNQPVKCLKCGKVYISTQNHAYEVVSETVNKGEVRFINVNDNSCEGIVYDEMNALTVQFAPDSFGVGHVDNPLYKKFFTFMKKENENA
ncbi:MAG: carbamoyl phosphate synthase small subunit [Clostridiales bacterium]|nr:carbamoyl phosphate synthase small subunit [Clostridiales bacterium]